MGARKNELETESHLKMIAERESGRLVQEIQRLKNDYSKMKERRNLHEVYQYYFIFNREFKKNLKNKTRMKFFWQINNLML